MSADLVAEFITAACVPRDESHASGTLDRADAILKEHPEVARANIHTAAILGDDAGVRVFIGRDTSTATAKGGPHEWDALTHLCFSRYLRLDPRRSDGFVRAAKLLLDAGASANTGWFEPNHQPKPEWEPALYGAAGIAHHPELTALLLAHGANPNDNEVVYHAPESYDNRALELLVQTGKLTDESLSLMLIRKLDWHDYEGVKWLLEHGANADRERWRGLVALHHALARDNSLEIITQLVDHGADPTRVENGHSAVAMAAREGRSDVLALFAERGIAVELQGVDGLIMACAMGDAVQVRGIAAREPRLKADVLAMGGELLAKFAGTGNVEGVRQLLDLGVGAASLYAQGDGYWDIAKNSTALHVAAWRAQHDVVKLLIERGAPVNDRDAKGRTPLMLAVKACIDSYWIGRRSPASVDALLRAGASVEGVPFPSGYAEVDELLRPGISSTL